MQAKHITPGMTVRLDTIPGRLAPATVSRWLPGGSRSRLFVVRTDEGVEHTVTAAKLLPMPGSILGGWETTGELIVAPGAIPGTAINRRRMMERMAARNARRIVAECGRVHVGESLLATVRSVYASAGKRSLRSAPPAFRRGVVHTILAARAANVAEHRAVMGHAPLPTEAQITAAMLAVR
jgi:hypothetical protein